MGTIPSQLNTSSIRVVNKLPEKKNEIPNTDKTANTDESKKGDDPKDVGLQRETTVPKLLVSIVDKRTVIISEGKSIGTQTDGDVINDETKQTIRDDAKTLADNPEDNQAPNVEADDGPRSTGTDQDSRVEQTTEDNDIDGPANDPDTRQDWDEVTKLVLKDSKDIPEYSESEVETLRDDKIDPNDDDDVVNRVSPILVDAKCLKSRPEVAFDDICLNKYGRYKVRLNSDSERCILSSATFMETGDVVVIDRSNQNLKYVDSKFQFISSYDFQTKPWAVCAKNSTVYVTFGSNQIQRFTISDMIIEPGDVIAVEGRCLGICIYGNSLAVGLQIGEIRLLDFLGVLQTTIGLSEINAGKPFSPWHLCASSQGNILVTDSDAGLIVCVNKSSEVIFSCDVMSSPRATTIDYHGNIIVVGRDLSSGAVAMVMYKDMELLRMLHMEADDTKTSKPRTLMTWETLEFVPYCVNYRNDDVVVLGGIQDYLKIMRLGEMEETSDLDSDDDV